MQLEGCTVHSATGSGVAAEGGEHALRSCRLLQCERHGLAVFGTLEGEECQVDVFECSLEGNKLDGVLVRDGGSVRLRDSELRGNGGYGMSASYATASVAGCRFGGNRKGEVQAGPGSDVIYE